MTTKQNLIMVFVFVLVCRVFSWGFEGPGNITPAINKWLQNKRIVNVQQSSCGDYRTQITYLIIIAEEPWTG